MPEELLVIGLGDRCDVLPRHDEHVERRARSDVLERDDVVVLVHEVRRQRPALDPAERAVGHQLTAAACFFSCPKARSRSCFASTRLRIRNDFGVTSSSSSSAMNSIASSSDSVRMPSSFAAMSELLLRMFVRCFFRQTLISRSRSRMCWPTIIPSYTSTPGPMNNVPRSCDAARPKVLVSPASNAMSEPNSRVAIGPAYGP